MPSSPRQSVLEYIESHHEKIVEFLQELVSYPSITGSEAGIQDFLAKWLRENLRTEKIDKWNLELETLKKHPAYVPVSMSYENRPNVVALCKGSRGKGGRSLVYNGHVDVIPSGSEESWNYEPWAGKISEGRLYGRGTSDMKGGLAAYTMAMQAIIASEVRLKGDVILEYVVDEELSGNGTLACLLKGYVGDAGISGETSSLRIQPASIGRMWFEIDVAGKPAGIQRHAEGINAIDKGYMITQAVNDFEQIRMDTVRHKLYPNIRETIPCIIGMFESGSYPSAFPDSCLLKGSIATVPGEDSDMVKSEFVEHIQTVARTDPWLNKNPPKVRFTGYFAEPSELPVDHPIVQSVIRTYKEVANRNPIISGRVGAADIRFYNKYGNTPMVIFGPGLSEQMHANNEYVGVDDLILATKVMALSTLDWCGFE